MRILVTGALGQIGSEIVPALRQRYGAENVVASDIRLMPGAGGGDPFELIDCTHQEQLQEVVRRLDIGTIYHLAALLSAIAEQKPHVAWDLNMSGLYGVLDVARRYECKVFFPSSIGAFGPSTPRDNTPQVAVQRPTTMYGLTKVAGELLCDYYFHRFGVDTRVGCACRGLSPSLLRPVAARRTMRSTSSIRRSVTSTTAAFCAPTRVSI